MDKAMKKALDIIDAWCKGRLPGEGNKIQSIELKPLENLRWLQQSINTKPFEIDPTHKPPR